MTKAQSFPRFRRLAIPSSRLPSDVTTAGVLSFLYVSHVLLILVYSSPVAGSYCCLPPIDTWLWVIAATLAIGSLIRGATRAGSSAWLKLLRSALIGLLLLCTIDTVTEGNNRWFSTALDRDLRVCGGPAGLQAWADKFLSPEHLHQDRDQNVSLGEMPPDVQRFARRFRMHWFVPREDQSWISLQEESAFLAYGVIVGRSDLDPSAFGQVIDSGWLRKVRPGVFYFANY